MNKRDFSVHILLAPYVILFCMFILIPVVLSMLLSLTYFNGVQSPTFTGLSNYIQIITQDSVFMQKVLPNTLIFAFLVGPISYVLQFLLAWLLAQLTKLPRTILALIFYAPSMTMGVTMSVIWKVVFAGDQFGYLNYFLLNIGIIEQPVQWLQSPEYILPIMIIISIWASMGVGFLAMLAGILNISPELYEAAYIDGLKNRFQEIVYITVPSIMPQMLFGAVMAIVGSFSAGQIGTDLTGVNPTPIYSGATLATHIDDHGFLQYEMGYASALAVVLLLLILLASKVSNKLFLEKE